MYVCMHIYVAYMYLYAYRQYSVLVAFTIQTKALLVLA